ncbi:MAG: 8-hydroxy-5-deazaflavin:NADPH oxidoreductase [Microbacteriaceae bacterium]|nr:8-hydroxy-5-deazaflavin:NADPH oxidoreductase [Microbacteriaceae bacterium]
MTKVSIIGVGNMGSAIARIAARSGADIQLLARDHDKATALAGELGGSAGRIGDPLTGDIVVLALPYGALSDVLAAYQPGLAGKIVVDITNPIDYSTFDGLVVPAEGSAAGEIAALLPAAKIVKAFNVNFAATLASGTVGGSPATVLVAGDDADAKSAVITLVRDGGLQAEDAGSLNRARDLESVGLLQVTMAVREMISWAGGFAFAK